MIEPGLLSGNVFSDTRGKLFAFNDFDMSEIVRCYTILPSSESVIRAWQAHQLEKKWFHCTEGAFLVNLLKIDKFESPAEDLAPEQFYLYAEQPQILAIPGGYANGFRSLKPNSQLIVYSNLTVAESAADDYRYSKEKWNVNWHNKEGETNNA